MEKILIVAELKKDEVNKSTLENLSYANSLGMETSAVLIGTGIKKQAEVLVEYGAKTVYVADDISLKFHGTFSYTRILQEAVSLSEPTQLWFTASEFSADLMPRIAARLGVGAISDITKLELKGNDIRAYHPAMSSKVIQECLFEKDEIRVLSMRGGIFDISEAKQTAPNIVKLSIPNTDLRAVIRDVVIETTEGVDLTEANIVVAVGRGVKDSEGVERVRPLVDMLQAGYGATRGACDAGLMPHGAQVGQTGKNVAPQIYIALGLSGAIQHVAGMTGSKLIIAVNNDPEAPIFNVADYGIVGDLFKVVPILTEEFKGANSTPISTIEI
jgi:electron transfer flavoprotein alpha subunit